MRPLEGVQVVELAQWAFVPSSAAVLRDWGADVLKVEHPGRGDAMRGFLPMGPVGGFDYMVEQFNRGKRSIGLDLTNPAGYEIFVKLVEQADVMVTSFLEPVKERLKVTYDDMKLVNPKLVYGRSSGWGMRGPEAGASGFDNVSYWSRGGIGHRLTPPEGPYIKNPAGFGDVSAGMYLASGIAAGLVNRTMTGEGCLVDVSLLSTAVWMLAPDIVSSYVGELASAQVGANPLAGAYKTGDGRYVALGMFQSDRYWEPMCQAMERADLVDDPRFNSILARADNRDELTALMSDEFSKRSMAEWDERLAANKCIWSVALSPLEVSSDPQVQANQYVIPHPTYEGAVLASSPVQFDGEPIEIPTGAPEPGQHTEEVLLEYGYTWDDIIGLKDQGAIT